MSIQTGNLNILSSADTFTQNQDTKDLSGSVSMTMYGGGAGAGFSANYGESHSNQDYTYNTNSELRAGNNMNIYVANDALIQGGELSANNDLSMYVGNNLDLISVRDSYSSSSNGKSSGYGLSADGSGLTGFGLSSSRNSGTYQQKQTVLSSITGNSVDIYVGSNTNMKGSLIAAGGFDENGNFIDNGQLNLDTGTLTYGSLSNTIYSQSKSISKDSEYVFGNGLGLSELENTAVGVGNTLAIIGNIADNGIGNVYSTGEATYNNFKQETDYDSSSYWGYSKETGYSSEKALSTVGEGSLVIRDIGNTDDLDGLNRNINSMNKMLYNGGTNINIPSFNYAPIIGKIFDSSVYLATIIKNTFQNKEEAHQEKTIKAPLFQELYTPDISNTRNYQLKKNLKENTLKIRD
jgi:filamentous hemagglutinin